MSIQNILQNTKHRPWKLPNRTWKYYQEWNRAIFLHWKVDFDVLRKFVPDEMEIDTFEGSPWVSLVAFSMEKIRPKNLPYFSPISNFDEINIRTYIKSGKKTGVYFLSIEGSKPLSCWIAKKISELPYRFSEMKREPDSYTSGNVEYNDSFNIQFNLLEEQKTKSALDIWLTERYALFQNSKEYINQYEIHHPEWSLQHINIDHLRINYPRFATLLTNNPDKMCYSKGVQVLAWGIQKKDKSDFTGT